MKVVFIDFETFWSKEHTLSKMSALDYVMHTDTEIISCATKDGDSSTRVIFGEDKIKKHLQFMDWSDSMAVAHNMSAFDAMILAWRFGVRPKMWGCTLAMAKPIHGLSVGNSLAKLVTHYKLGVKDNTALVQTQGKKLKDFTSAELIAMDKYNRADTDQCAALFKVLKKHYTAKELWQIDATIRMLVEPKFRVDTAVLEAAAAIERDSKRTALLDLYRMLRNPTEIAEDHLGDVGFEPEEYVREQMASAAKFAALLESRGVKVPMKPSPTNPDRTTPALAKTDEAFLKLQDHSDPVVAAAARVRLSVKSTLLETRIQAFLDAARCADGFLPIPLHYCGAVTTGRWSGWLFNPQNLPRVPRDKNGNVVVKPTNALRNCMRAPKGHKVVVADLSGIELRVNHFLWKVPSSMRLFQDDPAKADLYKDFASRLYDIGFDEVDKNQRQIGKIAHLGLGFGAGPATFQRIAKLMGGVDMPESEAMSVTYRWREEYAPIVDGWKTCHRTLPSILMGDRVQIDPWGLCHTEANAIVLPSGRRIRYPALEKETSGDKSEWFYGEGRNRARIYAGKIDENIVQALARDVIADCAFEVFRRTKLRPCHMVHDELVYIVPDAEAQAVLDEVQAVMRTPPSWWPELVTWSEGDIANTYGQAK
jgi:hypothetical protein